MLEVIQVLDKNDLEYMENFWKKKLIAHDDWSYNGVRKNDLEHMESIWKKCLLLTMTEKKTSSWAWTQ